VHTGKGKLCKYATRLKKARMEQIGAYRALRRETPSKDSIAMENPVYVTTDKSTIVKPPALDVRKRKQITPGERKALLARRNRKIIATTMRTDSTPLEEKCFMSIATSDQEIKKKPEGLEEGNNLNCSMKLTFRYKLHLHYKLTVFHEQKNSLGCLQLTKMKRHHPTH
jgi:hypothetical protein